MLATMQKVTLRAAAANASAGGGGAASTAVPAASSANCAGAISSHESFSAAYVPLVSKRSDSARTCSAPASSAATAHARHPAAQTVGSGGIGPGKGRLSKCSSSSVDVAGLKLLLQTCSSFPAGAANATSDHHTTPGHARCQLSSCRRSS